MTPSLLLSDLLQMTPEFTAAWHSESNHHAARDGRHTFAGVCSQYSDYFVDQNRFAEPSLVDRTAYPTMSDGDMRALFAYVEKHVSNRDASSDDLVGALLTCFVENIASTPAGRYARRFMGDFTRQYFDQWHVD